MAGPTGRRTDRSERQRVVPPLITLQQQVLPEGAIRMDMPLHVVVDTSALRSTTNCPAAALRRSKPAFIDMRAGDRVESLMQHVLHALAQANRLGRDFMDHFDSTSVQLVPTASAHKIALDRGGSRRLWQYFATEIMEGIEVKLQLKLTPPEPPHARGYKVQTPAEKAASAKAAARAARERALRAAQMPHPPTEPRVGAAPPRVDRVDTVAARVVNRVQAGIAARRQCNADFFAREKEIKEAMAILGKVNEKRVALEQQKLSQFAFKPSERKHVMKSAQILAARVKISIPVSGFVPVQQSQLVKEQQKFQAAKETKEDDVRPPAVDKRLGFAGLRKDLRPKKHKSRVKVESRKNADLSKEGAKVLTAEERQQRESDQISYVLNNMISGKRKLYGTMMRDARSAFEAIDKDGSGSLDYSEFAAFLKRLGLGLKEEQTRELAKLMDADGSGEIDCDEFVAALEAAEKRAKEQEEREKQKLDEENEAIRRAAAAQKQKSCSQEHEQEHRQKLSGVEHMRERISRTKRNQERYAYLLTSPHSQTQPGFGSPTALTESVTSSNGELRVMLPGAYGVTTTISESEPDSIIEGISSIGDNFTAADYTEVIDEMEAAEVMDACRHWGIEADDISLMREKLHNHYASMHDHANSHDKADQADEVPEEPTLWEVDKAHEEHGLSASQMALAPVEVPVEEVTGVSHDAVLAAVTKMYDNMDIEKQEAAVAAALRFPDTDDELSEEDPVNDTGHDDEAAAEQTGTQALQ